MSKVTTLDLMTTSDTPSQPPNSQPPTPNTHTPPHPNPTPNPTPTPHTHPQPHTPHPPTSPPVPFSVFSCTYEIETHTLYERKQYVSRKHCKIFLKWFIYFAGALPICSEQPNSSPWLQMPSCQIGTMPLATTGSGVCVFLLLQWWHNVFAFYSVPATREVYGFGLYT